MSGPLAARLICMGVDVLSQDEETARAFDDLNDLLVYAGNGDHEAGLREVLRMLADAADAACDAHCDDAEVGESFDAMMKFASAIRAAKKEIDP